MYVHVLIRILYITRVILYTCLYIYYTLYYKGFDIYTEMPIPTPMLMYILFYAHNVFALSDL